MSSNAIDKQAQMIGVDDRIKIYVDGGARGNPGPAAIGVVIGEKEYSSYLGETTNNVAEYSAVIFALKKAKALLGKSRAAKTSVVVYVDSELVERQLTRKYKVRNEDLKLLFVDVYNLLLDFGDVVFCHIPREKNARADALVNQELDSR